ARGRAARAHACRDLVVAIEQERHAGARRSEHRRRDRRGRRRAARPALRARAVAARRRARLRRGDAALDRATPAACDRGVAVTRAALMALAAAALFGASAPVAKRLLAEVSPALLAALLYAGEGLMALPFAARAWKRREAPLRAADLPLLAGVVAFGGVAAPLLLLFGLQRTSATATSLLLNLEAVFTTAIAVVVFREWIGRRGLGALVVVIAGCALSTWAAGGATRTLLGPLAVAAACLFWAIDNNLTQRL